MSASTPIKGTAFAHLDFILTGVVMTLLGPVLPVLSADWLLNDMQAGYLLAAQFAASILGMLLSGVLVERYGYRRTLLAGLLLMAAGIGLLAHATWMLGLTAVCIYGFGFGTNTPAGNLFIAEANPAKRASALNLLNSSWGIGAMSSPLLVALAQRWQRVPLFLYLLAACLVVLALALSRVRFLTDTHRAALAQAPTTVSSAWNHRLLPVILLLFFIYVGTENSVGGWVATYAKRIDPSSLAFWAITPSFFWGALLAGRALAPLALRRVPEARLATFGVSLAALGVCVLLLARSMTPVVAGAVLAGMGCASVFPISVSLLPHWLGESVTRTSGVIFAVGNLGGAVLPGLVGAVSTRVGSLRVGLLVPLFGALAMLVFYLAEQTARTSRPVPTADSP